MFRSIVSLCSTGSIALLFLAASSACANPITITAQLTGVQNAPPYTTVSMTLYTDASEHTLAKDSDGNNVSGNYIAGAELWHRTGGGTVGQGNDFRTFCIEITQDVFLSSPASSYTFNLQSNLANAPVPGSYVVPVPAPGPGMGTTKADLISRLWAADYSSSLTNATNSAAFQLAVWKIVYGDPIGSTTNLDLNLAAGHGQLVAPVGSGEQSSIVNQAQSWLNGLPTDTEHANLVALTSIGNQDQITAAPLPATASLGLVLMGGLGAMATIRQKRKPCLVGFMKGGGVLRF